MPARVYLAGPDVFLPDPRGRGEALRRICARHGLEGIFPLDPLPDEPADWVRLPPARAIARRNEAQIRRADAVIANLTPFRGPGADNGTAYEIGFARALGRPVFAWSTAAGDYLSRCRDLRRQDGTWRDAEGMEVEAFGLCDNLMLACAVTGLVVTGRDLSAFEGCVQAAAQVLRK